MHPVLVFQELFGDIGCFTALRSQFVFLTFITLECDMHVIHDRFVICSAVFCCLTICSKNHETQNIFCDCM